MTVPQTPDLHLDFRSDTITQPSKEMREAMAYAPVGDDVFGEDPTINELEQKTASLFGHEAALYCASGTQTNQVAIQVHCQPGDEVVCAMDAHIYKYEGGGIARNAGASVHLVKGDKGRISHQDVLTAIHNDDVHYPITSLVSLEDTVNRGGGCTYDLEELKKIRSVCLDQSIPLHVDGARVFNAIVAKGHNTQEYGRLYDSISICLSKGLGAPVGSVLIGNKDFIHKARRVRKVMGGGMRQAGILAAAGLYALNNNVDRLADDHRRAQVLGSEIAQLPYIVEVLDVETNLVIASVQSSSMLDRLTQYLDENGIRIIPFSATSFRIVTHLHHTDDSVSETMDRMKEFRA